MQPQRLRQAEAALSGIARRVLEAVPIAEAWTVAQICSELGRTGSPVDMAKAMGCLRTAVGQGLVKEPHMLTFQRVHIPEIEQPPIPPAPLRVVHPQPELTMSKPAPVIPATLPADEPLARIGALAARLREQGRQLIKQAEDIEAVGLEFEARIDAAKQGSAKVMALRELLKSLAD
jgi:hypothetical protein